MEFGLSNSDRVMNFEKKEAVLSSTEETRESKEKGGQAGKDCKNTEEQLH
jgi:hypothetical protein